jgi:hypothetical protein
MGGAGARKNEGHPSRVALGPACLSRTRLYSAATCLMTSATAAGIFISTRLSAS